MQNIFELEVIAREKRRELLATAEANRQINKVIRKKRARKILNQAVERGLRDGLTVDELISELRMALDRNGYTKQAKHVRRRVIDSTSWQWQGALTAVRCNRHLISRRYFPKTNETYYCKKSN